MSTKDAWDLFETKKDRKRRKRLQMYGLYDDDDIIAKRSRAARLGSAVSSSAAKLIGSAGGAAFRFSKYGAHLVGRSAAAISATGAPERIGKFAKKSGIALFNEIVRRSGPAISAAAAYIKLPKEASTTVPAAISPENAAQMYNAAVPVLLTAFAAASSHGHILKYSGNEYDDAEDEEKNNGMSILGTD